MYRGYHLFKYNREAGEPFTVIAHRGASAYFPENTLAAFHGAIDLKADMVELDVQMTADGEIVVFHDEIISRCTNGKGCIADYTLVQLKKLDAGSWFSKEFQKEKIPTLAETLELCRDKIAVNIEIKTEAVSDDVSGGIEEKCLAQVHSAGMEDHVVFSSFDPRALLHLKQIDHTAPIAVLYERNYHGSGLPSQILANYAADAFNCSLEELSAKWLSDLRINMIPVNVYTINDKNNMMKLLDHNISGIFTNHPDLLRKTLKDFRGM